MSDTTITIEVEKHEHITVFAFQELAVHILWINGAGRALGRYVVRFGDNEDPVEVARRAAAKIDLHDFKRIAGALGLEPSESTTIDAMVAKIENLRVIAGY